MATKKWIAALLALGMTSAHAGPSGLMKEFGDDFDPLAVTADFVEACKIVKALDSEKLSDDQTAVGLLCLGVMVGVAGVFDGSPKFTLNDGHTTVTVCPNGQHSYRAMATKALELAESGEIDVKQVTPAQLALAAVLRVQTCQSD
jgi:hypothetical protein